MRAGEIANCDESDEPEVRPLPYMRRSAICELFAAGLERVRSRQGEDADLVRGAVFGEDGRLVCFDLVVEHGLVKQATFRASPCISLVAYAEWLARYVEGKSRAALRTVSFDTIVSGVAEVNAGRKLRARLLFRAFESTLDAWDHHEENETLSGARSMRAPRSAMRLTHSFVFEI